MPLRHHFRPPLDDVHSWDELHGMWPAMIVRQLIEPYAQAEADIDQIFHWLSERSF